jgi:hypothetical protein
LAPSRSAGDERSNLGTVKVGTRAGPAKADRILTARVLDSRSRRKWAERIDCRISVARETRGVKLEALALQSLIRSAALRPR